MGVGKGVASSEVNLFAILDVGKSRFIIYAGRTDLMVLDLLDI